MTHKPLRLTRRASMLLPLAAAGCQTLDEWFGDKKTPLSGARVDILAVQRGLIVDNPAGRVVTLPPPVANAAWSQAGAEPSHAPGNLAVGRALATQWSAKIGAPSGYRRKITATPVVAGAQVFAMDSAGEVSAYDRRSGAQLWRTVTAQKDDRSTNVGGGISLDGGTLFAATGLAGLLALDAGTGKVRWRQALPAPARAAPTIVDEQLYVPTLDGQVLSIAKANGSRQWAYQGPVVSTSVLGLPSPAFADGLLVAGFGSGELACLRAASGAVTWSDGLASGHGQSALLDIAAVTALPVIVEGRVYAVGLGGLFVSIDLRSGRRLWERQVASQQTPWLAGDWLFVLTPDQLVGAVNRSDGAVAWVTQLPLWQDEKKQEGPIGWIGPVLAGNRLILLGSNKEVLAVDPVTGKPGTRQTIDGAAAVAPAIAGDTLFVVTVDGTLLALH
ncbi:MAG: PQQ-binding-like beta-propeller repeat protein [Rhodospirillales bacterium]|nr:PQQ-binding-like beta-propeller repeat protein [Rhodospirillales bacterium]